MEKELVKLEDNLTQLKAMALRIREENLLDKLQTRDPYVLAIVDSFVHRFSILQDYLGQKFFRRFLLYTGDYQEGMTTADIIDRLEKLGFIPSADDWFDMRELRNQMTHEYSDHLHVIKESISKAMDFVPVFEDIIERVKTYLQRH